VTLSSPEHPSASGPVPPPECPAHAMYGGATHIDAVRHDGLRRMYGPEAEADPRGLYEKLRAEHGSVAPVLVHGDLPAWLILGYQDNLDVARTPSRFTRDSRLWRDMREGRVAPDNPLTPVATWQPMCTFMDGPEHERLRRAVTESLARFDRRGVRRHVTRFAHQLIDRFSGSGRAELVSQFAEQLPMLVMTQLVGMPEEYGTRLVEAARDLVKGTETALASNDYIVGTLRQLVARRRDVPGDDFASWLIAHPAGLADSEMVEHLRLVLITAYESTANLIANTLRVVFTDQRFRVSLAGGRMTLPEAVEQVLWDEPPLTTILGRWATGDTELAGWQIKAGDLLLLGPAPANVDPAIRPDLAAPVHGNRSHFSFGGGPHECPGQDIGRAIADTGIDTLLMRLPDARLTVPEEELLWTSSLIARHLVALPVEFSPVKPRRPETVTAVVPDVPAPISEPPSGPQTRTSARTTWWQALTRRLTRRRH
jgi:cytochrome P450